MLEYQALKFYYYFNNILFNIKNPVIKKLHYIPLMKDDNTNNIYIHTDSVVSYCHRFGGEQFNQLTRKSFNKEFPIFKVITGGSSRSFRVTSKEEFDRICK